MNPAPAHSKTTSTQRPRRSPLGTHEQLLKNCAVYQEIATSQLSKEELGYDAE